MGIVRREIYYSGRVQGVGFRYTTSRLAARYEVSGFVQNLHDGRVYLVIEGTPPELDSLTEAIHAAMGSHIHDMQTLRTDAQGEFTTFEIRY